MKSSTEDARCKFRRSYLNKAFLHSHNARPVADTLLRMEEEGAAGLVLEAGPVRAVVEHAAVVRVGEVRVVLRPAVDYRPLSPNQTLT